MSRVAVKMVLTWSALLAPHGCGCQVVEAQAGRPAKDEQEVQIQVYSGTAASVTQRLLGPSSTLLSDRQGRALFGQNHLGPDFFAKKRQVKMFGSERSASKKEDVFAASSTTAITSDAVDVSRLGQSLLLDHPAETIGQFESLDVGRVANSEKAIAIAAAAKAYLGVNQFEEAVDQFERLAKDSRLRRYFPADVLAIERANAKAAWAKSGQLDLVKSNAQWRSVGRILARAKKIKTNRLSAPMAVARARALVAMRGAPGSATDRAYARTALRPLESVIKEYPNHPEIGDLMLERARLLKRMGKLVDSQSALRRLVIERAGELESDIALRELAELAKQSRRLGFKELSLGEQLERAQSARRLRNVELSRKILDKLSTSVKSSSSREKVLLARANTAYRERDYIQCVKDLRSIYQKSQGRELLYFYSRCLDRAAQYQEAVDLWLDEATRRKRKTSAHSKSLWKALEISFRGGMYEQTERILARFEKVYKSHRSERTWLKAWLPYRLGRTDEALSGFKQLAKRRNKQGVIARYFLGKLQLESPSKSVRKEGEQVLRKLVAKDTLGYYGLMARQRLLDARLDAGPMPDVAPLEDEARRYSHSEVLKIFDRALNEFGDVSRSLARAKQLYAAGYLDDAQRELRVAADEMLYGSPRKRVVTVSGSRNEDLVVGLGWAESWRAPKISISKNARMLLRNGSQSARYREQLRELCRALGESYHMARLTSSEDGSYYARWYQRAYQEPLIREAGLRSIDPIHLWSLMYTESRFRRHVVSPVGARGAVQIMPWTGEQIQVRMGDFNGRFDPDSLFDIDTNLHMAAYYIAELLAKFQNQSALAYASYNGGPSNVARWLEAKHEQSNVAIERNVQRRRPLGLDDFIEEMPFTETYRYTRRVMEVHAGYNLLYNGRLPRWSNKLDPKVEDNIEF